MQITSNQLKIVSLVFFLSGCSALIFETVWFRIASTVLGSSIWSAAAVLMAFMAGLGLGNILIAWHGRKIKKPVTFYIVLEVMIGVTGMLSVLLLPLLSPIMARLASEIINNSGVLNLIRFSFAFSVFLIPAVAMGATLPVLQKVIYTYDNSFTRSFARLYGWNTSGAVLGTLIAEFWLITFIGIKGTALAASLLNLIAAFILLRSLKISSTDYSNEEIQTQETNLFEYKWHLIAPFLSGLILLALEVVWFRYMILVKDATSTIFAIMLAIVLTGIGIGGFLATHLTYRHYNIDKTLKYLVFLTAISVVIGFYVNNQLVNYLFSEIRTSLLYFSFTAVILMLPTSIMTGMLFPLFAEKLFRHIPETTRASGIVTFMNTSGAAIGSGLATFILLPLLGIERSLFVLAVGYFVVLLIVFTNVEHKERLFPQSLLPITGFVMLLVLFPFGTMENFYTTLSKKMFPSEELVMVKEGLNETLRYHKQKRFGQTLSHRLITNNHSMSATTFPAIRYMKLYAYFPYIIHSDIKDVLQISYGVGNTAEAITRLNSVENFDIVDVSKDVLELSSIIHEDTQWFPLNDKRANVHIEDGRFYLQTTTKTYDLITGEPPPPKMSGIVNLYTEEYFKLMKSRLNPGGIVTYWLPVHSLLEGDTLSIISSFCGAFNDCSLWNGTGLDFMLVGSNGGIQPVSESRLNEIWNSYLASELKIIGLERPSQLGALYMADNKTLRKITKYSLPVTDDFPHRISTSAHGYNAYADTNLFLLDLNRRQSEFSQSAYIKTLFSQELIDKMKADFLIESMLTKIDFSHISSKELKYWKELHYLITNTNLEVAPLLYMKSNPHEQKLLLKAAKNNDPDFIFKQAIGALSNRNYHSASELLQKCIKLQDKKTLHPYMLKLYYFIKALDKDLIPAELERTQPMTLPEITYSEWIEYMSWIKKTF